MIQLSEPKISEHMHGATRTTMVYVEILAPIYWWRVFDIITDNDVHVEYPTFGLETDFKLEDFSSEGLPSKYLSNLCDTIDHLNMVKQDWVHNYDGYTQCILKLLPSCYNEKRTVALSYIDLGNIYKRLNNVTVSEWNDFITFIKDLPNSCYITGTCF